MTKPGVYCECGCHYELPEGRVNVNDAFGSIVACHRCKANHKPPQFIPEPPWRRENFDKPEPFKPDTSTAWNDDQGDGTNGRDNAP